ncbi:MAG: hypothetical protein WDN30_14445 [Pararobbsia sp.]
MELTAAAIPIATPTPTNCRCNPLRRGSPHRASRRRGLSSARCRPTRPTRRSKSCRTLRSRSATSSSSCGRSSTQPRWRLEADTCADYYDGNQLSVELIDKLKDRGQPPLITNLIKPTVDTVLGMEAKSRTDWIVRPEDDTSSTDDVAEALSLKLKHAETESRADRACSDAYCRTDQSRPRVG